jgi:hypothetical protein
MREIESHSADKDTARLEKHQSIIAFRRGVTLIMLQIHSLLVLTLAAAVVTAGKYRLSYAFNIHSLTVLSNIILNLGKYIN